MKLALETSTSSLPLLLVLKGKKCLQWSMTFIFINRWGFSKVLRGISCSLLQRIAVMDGHLSPRNKCNACFPQTTTYKTLAQFLLSIPVQVDWVFMVSELYGFFTPKMYSDIALPEVFHRDFIIACFSGLIPCSPASRCHLKRAVNSALCHIDINMTEFPGLLAI